MSFISERILNCSFEARESVPITNSQPSDNSISTGGILFSIYMFEPGQRHQKVFPLFLTSKTICGSANVLCTRIRFPDEVTSLRIAEIWLDWRLEYYLAEFPNSHKMFSAYLYDRKGMRLLHRSP